MFSIPPPTANPLSDLYIFKSSILTFGRKDSFVAIEILGQIYPCVISADSDHYFAFVIEPWVFMGFKRQKELYMNL